MQSRFDALRQILLLEDLPKFSCSSLIHHMILDVLCQIRPDDAHAIRFILSQSFSDVSSGFSSKRREFLRFDAVRASMTSHQSTARFICRCISVPLLTIQENCRQSCFFFFKNTSSSTFYSSLSQRSFLRASWVFETMHMEPITVYES